jgi:hypothetical protein
MSKYLKDFDYEIFVVEQKDKKPFNRGKLLNIGAKYAMENGCDYLCFHDVDLLPIDVDYTYPDYPTSLISEIENKEGDILFRYFGGVTLFSVEDFISINGYSNEYWGWGFEDDDLFHRVTHGGLFFDVEKVGVKNYSTFWIDFKEKDHGYVEIDPEMLDGDFSIECSVKVESKYFDENKDYDEYPIFSIPGYNIGLFYNSFNRFFFQVYDSDKKPYSINSDVYDDLYSTFEVIKRGNKITMNMNGTFVGSVELEEPILNLGNRFMYVSAFSDRELCEFDMKLTSLKINSIELSTTDIVLKGARVIEDGEISSSTSIPKPIRRSGVFRELYHDNNSSIEKSWVHKETRKNQIYYNNIVKQNLSDFNSEGLNSMKYTVIDEKENKGYRKISVEI